MKSYLPLLFFLFSCIYSGLGQNLSTKLDSIAVANDVLGHAVVVFCESEVLHSHYYGIADLERNLAINANTKFRIASISKMITGIAVMQLVDQNLLDLDADISTILGYPIQNPNHPSIAITTRMLLSHTSTIIDGPTYPSFLSATVNNNPIPNLDQILTPTGAYYSSDQFNNTTPGTYFNYSNLNYVILGTILEKVSNLRFDQYCRQHLFEPLGLDASFNVNDLQDINRLAVLYRKINGNWTDQVDNYQGVQPIFDNLDGYIPGTNGGRFGPQGGLRISAKDLATLFLCLNDPSNCPNTVLSPEGYADMHADEWTYNGNNGNNYFGLFNSWGLGMHRITSSPGDDIVLPQSTYMFGHAGEAYGLVSDLYFDPVRKVGLVFMTNGVGTGYQTNSFSGFYTIEQAIFNAIEQQGELTSCLTTSNENLKSESSQILIAPNPSQQTIQATFNQDKTLPQQLEVYSIDGIRLHQMNIEINPVTLDISDWKKGIYLIRIGEEYLKFVKS